MVHVEHQITTSHKNEPPLTFGKRREGAGGLKYPVTTKARSKISMPWKAVPSAVLRGVIGGTLFFHVALVVLFTVAGLFLKVINPPVSSLQYYRALTDGITVAQPRRFVPLSQVPPRLTRMLVRVEDRQFYHHIGIDPAAMLHAMKVNRRAGEIVLGGSTITQQMTRTLFLSPRRTYARKYVEVIGAIVLDVILSKDRILELYVNNIEWGPGVYGIYAAAHYQYNNAPEKLSLDEERRLAAVITDPVDFTVRTLSQNRGMRQRYAYLKAAFPGS